MLKNNAYVYPLIHMFFLLNRLTLIFADEITNLFTATDPNASEYSSAIFGDSTNTKKMFENITGI
jgi:hypothetical protein